MAGVKRFAVLSDIHYAGPREQQRGNDYEYRGIENPLLRILCHYYRHFIWLRHPLIQNHLLNAFLVEAGEPDHVFALGDYSCDTGFVGVRDDAALESASRCLQILRNRYGERLYTLIGDHELGKFPLIGKRGGMRFESWQRTVHDLKLPPFWEFEMGAFHCVGITSSLVTLPQMSGEILESDRDHWDAERTLHLERIREIFNSMPTSKRILLFCHDPTALPFLWEEPAVQQCAHRIERTFVGHLHSPLIFWKSKRLAGIPTIRFLGHSVRKLSNALGRARLWNHSESSCARHSRGSSCSRTVDF